MEIRIGVADQVVVVVEVFKVDEKMKLTIVTINYNNVEGLKRTLSSLPWGLTDVESVVIDGGSTDGSVAVAESYVELGAMVVSEPDNGIYDALNRGIVKAKGEFLSFMNSGDVYEEGVFPSVLSRLEGRVIYYGDRFSGPHRVLSKYPKSVRAHHLMTGLRSLCHQSMFVPRVLFDELGLYDDSMQIVADWAWSFKALMTADISFVHLNQVVCHYEGGGLSSAESPLFAKAEEERLRFLKTMYPRVYEDWMDYVRLLEDESQRKKSGIHRWADRIFQWKNSRGG